MLFLHYFLKRLNPDTRSAIHLIKCRSDKLNKPLKMNKYKINMHGVRQSSGRPGKENPLPIRTDPDPETPEQQPDKSPKRKKKSIYEIVMQ
jgi:hypothetical protein